MLLQAAGEDTTVGQYSAQMYFYAAAPPESLPRPDMERCFRVLPA